MLKSHKIIRNIVYSLMGGVGICCAAWLMFALKNDDSDLAKQRLSQDGQLMYLISSNDDESLTTSDFDQVENSLVQVKGVISRFDKTQSGQCSAQCKSTFFMLDEDSELEDDTFQKLDIYAEEIAAYLQGDESKRQHYLQMALATTDGDKRRFLTDIFMHLPHQQKIEIGKSFIDSENWRVRADGVALITDPGTSKKAEHKISNLNVVKSLMSIFSNEDNSYVKGRILSYLKQSSTLQGDAEILHQLDSAIYNEVDPSVRVAALKAKMQLSEQPYHILPDALQALRTNEPELQLAGLIAIEQVLQHEKTYIENGVYIDRSSIKGEFQMIRHLAVYDADKKRFDHLIREANAVYLRYFN